MIDIRKEVCNIISEMLDNPGECEIYPTTRAYDKLESFIRAELARARREAIGYMYAEACAMLDKGEDIRTVEFPELAEKAIAALDADGKEGRDGG